MRVSLGRAGLVALVMAYALGAVAGLLALVWSGLAPAQRAAVGAVARDQAAELAAGAAVVVAGLAGLVGYALGRYAAVARRLAADTRLVVAANPEHRVPVAGPAELTDLAAAVNELAELRRVAEREVARQVGAARADVEAERNRLASVIAELAVAVLVCNADGRILLYNAAARALVGDDSAVGLGRSVYDVVERDLVEHGLARAGEGAGAYVATVLRGDRLLRVRLAPVTGAGAGFVVVLDDETERLRSAALRDRLLRDLAEGTRASLGSIRAAIETLLDYPDMDAVERRAFAEIVSEEALALGERVARWSAESAALAGEAWPLTDIRGGDLLAILAAEMSARGLPAAVAPGAAGEVWLRVDSHALARLAGDLAACLRAERGVEGVSLALSPGEHHAGVDVRWTGRPPEPEAVRAWLDRPAGGERRATAREVVERHGGEVWCAQQPGGTAYARLLLPRATGGGAAAETTAAGPAAGGGGVPPELYDFDLFDLAGPQLSWADRRLADLDCTVLDTETTGLDPARDEIVSIGAVRVVNGRVLRAEALDLLVDPRRPVPAQAAAVHGITTEMLRGQPPIEDALPRLARFARDSVLVGHNVGFDMRLLREKEQLTGVRFSQPVLDTLLLDAALHPDHEEHTLEAVAARLGVAVQGRHSALGDALTTAEVFLRQVALLADRDIVTLGQALAASRATLHARRDRALYER